METVTWASMILNQIEARGIRDLNVLAAFRQVDRALFVPTHARNTAYEDYPLPIGSGQTISQPYIVALMTELLEVEPHHRVLEVGTGSGYQTAILARLAREVYTVEIFEPLATQAQHLLENLGYDNVHPEVGNGVLGWPDAAPFDRIMVTAAPEQVPPQLLDQLAPKGRLVIPVGPMFSQQLKIFIKKAPANIQQIDSIPVRFVPMVGLTPPPVL
jgi:protein-L-isoaspartate(D-aspartate) O-methyltransferase